MIKGRWLIIISLVIVIVGYLYDLPNSDGIEEKNRLRLLNVSMKMIRLIVRIFHGLSCCVLHICICFIPGLS